jgi:hypothetical protein
MPAEFRPRGLLEHLTRHGVDFVVVGGIAAALHGSERNTFDLDVCPRQDAANLDALGTALVEVDARLRGIDEDVPFVADGRSLAGIEILTLSTTLGPLDVLVRPHESPPYAALRRRATRMDVGVPGPVLIASIDDLIAMKRETDRPKDRDDIERLEALARLSRRLARDSS